MYDLASNNPSPVINYEGVSKNITGLGFQVRYQLYILHIREREKDTFYSYKNLLILKNDCKYVLQTGRRKVDVYWRRRLFRKNMGLEVN